MLISISGDLDDIQEYLGFSDEVRLHLIKDSTNGGPIGSMLFERLDIPPVKDESQLAYTAVANISPEKRRELKFKFDGRRNRRKS